MHREEKHFGFNWLVKYRTFIQTVHADVSLLYETYATDRIRSE